MAGDHLCRICGKTFPSGRSLGGHMRSHVPTSSSANANVDVELSSRSYALRENRKKTWRLSESSATGEKLCRECGKGFPSWNSLFGHMRCHPHVDHADADDDDRLGEEQQSEENEAVAATTRRRTRRRSRRVAAIPASSSSEQEEKEQQDVAYSLMMLSRDVAGFWAGNATAAVYSDDKHSAAGGSEMAVSDDGFVVHDGEKYNGAGLKKRKVPSDLAELYFPSSKIEAGSKYECSTCNKGFSTYQALGGHRASHHKKMKSCVEAASMTIDGSENSVETEVSVDGNAGGKKAGRGCAGNHECPVCHKVFVSGQALGGHKRSHMIIQQQQQTQPPGMPDLIDLNLPAPVDEASASTTDHGDVEFKPWWVRPLVGMISN